MNSVLLQGKQSGRTRGHSFIGRFSLLRVDATPIVTTSPFLLESVAVIAIVVAVVTIVAVVVSCGGGGGGGGCSGGVVVVLWLSIKVVVHVLDVAGVLSRQYRHSSIGRENTEMAQYVNNVICIGKRRKKKNLPSQQFPIRTSSLQR